MKKDIIYDSKLQGSDELIGDIIFEGIVELSSDFDGI